MKNPLLFFCVLLCTSLFSGQYSFAQDRVLSGQVLDQNGEPLPAASVLIKGTQSGTMTDMSGNFSLNFPEGADAIVISALGYEAYEVPVTDVNQPIVANLNESTDTELEGVNIVGTQIDRKQYTGSVTKVTAEQIERRPVTNVISALAGNTPGVSITSGGGQPGSTPQIVIRGFGSLSANNAPLIVLNGTVYQGTLASINPMDVETMDVLKDATATSLYGPRGGNGVILITTKQGKKSLKPTINIDAQVGIVNRMLPLYETVSARDYYELAYAGYLTSSTSPSLNQFMSDIMGSYAAFKVPEGEDFMVPEGDQGQMIVNPRATQLWDDNWIEELSRVGIRHQYNFSIQNGDNNSNYYFSLGYNSDQGVIKMSHYDRITSRLSVNSKITNWLRGGIDLGGTYDDQRFFLGTNNAYQNPFHTGQMIGAVYPVYLYDHDGNLQRDAEGNPLYDFGVEFGRSRQFAYNMNPVASLYLDDRSTNTLQANGNTYLEAKFLKDFTARATMGFNYYTGRTNAMQNMVYGDAENVGGRFNRTYTNQMVYEFNKVLTWRPSFDIFAEDHNLTVSLVHNNYAMRSEGANMTRTGFTDPVFQEGNAAAVNVSSASTSDWHRLEMYLASLNYNWKDKYYLNANINRSGTSRFAPETRWGTFWAVGGGWMISEEPFLKDNYSSWLTELKIRASYGISGQENLGGSYYPWMPRFAFNPNGNFPGYTFSSWGNRDLRWEGQVMFDPGIDFILFNGRLSGTLEYYIRQSKDLLYVRPLAPSTGIGGIQENIGKTQNAGVELTLRGDVIRKRNFSWNVDLNLTHYKNKILEMQGEEQVIYGSGTIFGVGYSVMEFYMPHYLGVDPTSGLPEYAATVVIDDTDGSLIDNPSGRTTDYQSANLPQNRKHAGSAIRDLEGGITNTFTYKGFDLSFLVTFGIGGKFYDNTYARLMAGANGRSGTNWHVDMMDRWQKSGDVTDVPRVDFGQARTDIDVLSDRFLTSNSFLNIRSANLGYTLPSGLMKRSGFTTFRVFVAAENIWLLAARKGLDIQQSFFGTSSFNYSPYRTIMFGVKVGL